MKQRGGLAELRRVLELAPKYWKQTLEQQDTQQLLAANRFRKISTRS